MPNGRNKSLKTVANIPSASFGWISKFFREGHESPQRVNQRSGILQNEQFLQ
jgi:hypothetical protein